MGNEVRGVPETPELTDPIQGSIGIYLARQRRLRGVSLDDLAELTKIPRRSLERLEAGAFDGEPDGFSRGFVRTIAEALGLDPEDAIMRMSGEPLDADDEAASQIARNYRWLAMAVGASITIAAMFAAGWLWDQVDLSVAWSDEPEIVYRRDAVRALAQLEAESRAESQTGSQTGAAAPASPDASDPEAAQEGPGTARIKAIR